MLGVVDQNTSPFENKVRVRVCGILKEQGAILLIKHEGIGPSGFLWSPPGGGVEFGQSLTATLKKEFMEETNLTVDVNEYLFTNEHIDDKHHAIELFFRVTRRSGELRLGYDPELDASNQMLSEVRFFASNELAELTEECLHSAFRRPKSKDKIDDLRGLITFKD